MAYTNKLNPVEQAKESAMWEQASRAGAIKCAVPTPMGKEIPALMQRLFDVVNHLEKQSKELESTLAAVTRSNFQVDCPKDSPSTVQTELGQALEGLASRLEMLAAATDVLMERVQV